MVPRDVGVAVASERDLALLGHLEPAVDRPGRLGDDRARRGAAAATERASAAVEQRDRQAAAPAPVGDRALGLVERERGGEHAGLLRRVGVAEHHLEPATVRAQARADRRERDDVVQDRGRVGELGRGLEQRHDVEPAGERGVGPSREPVGSRDVGRLAREADDEPVARLLAERGLDRGDRAEGGVGLGVGPRRRRAEHGRVLADLDRGEVEAERVGLPREMREVAVGEDRGAS